jgi:hypothetical protein
MACQIRSAVVLPKKTGKKKKKRSFGKRYLHKEGIILCPPSAI